MCRVERMSVLTCEYCGEPIKRGYALILDRKVGMEMRQVYVHKSCVEKSTEKEGGNDAP